MEFRVVAYLSSGAATAGRYTASPNRVQIGHIRATPLGYQTAGLAIAVPGSVSGNCAALSIEARIWRT